MANSETKTAEKGGEKDAEKKSHAVVGPSGKMYYPVIGLEIHAELKTQSKMFCSCRNNPDEMAQNKNICAVCMGHPGTLPVLNKQAIKHVIRVGVAAGSDIANFTEWDRKNYFYPDIPKGYQISQYAYPLVKNGTIGGVKLTRIHLEEDTASSSHDHPQDANGQSYSLVDFNRAGVPLMELVTEPVIFDAKTAGNFAKELQLLLRELGAGDANMEKGEMRVEANISVSTDPRAHEFPYDFKHFGRKVEVKNLNSFRSAERAIEFEIARHIDILERAAAARADANPDSVEKIVQETRGFDETTGKTFSQRAKEDSHDYRYFPDPDLPKLFTQEIPEFNIETIRAELPMLPWERRARYVNTFGMKDEDAEMFVQNRAFRDFFESLAETAGVDVETVKLAVNYVTSDIAGLIKKLGGEIKIPAAHFAEIITLAKTGELSSRGAKDLIALYWSENAEDVAVTQSKTPKQIAEDRGMIIKNDPEALRKMIVELVDANPNVVADYKGGKEASLMFFVGQIMKAMKGAVNPQVAKEEILKIIAEK